MSLAIFIVGICAMTIGILIGRSGRNEEKRYQRGQLYVVTPNRRKP